MIERIRRWRIARATARAHAFGAACLAAQREGNRERAARFLHQMHAEFALRDRLQAAVPTHPTT